MMGFSAESASLPAPARCGTAPAPLHLRTGLADMADHELRESVGERQRIRVNAVLNATGKRGPGLANTLGCIGAHGHCTHRRRSGCH